MGGILRLLVLIYGVVGCYGVNVSSLFGLDPKQPKSLCMDLVFMVDTSCSVEQDDIPKLQKFMTDMVDGIEELSPLATMVGVGMFDMGARVVIPLGKYTDKTELKNAITTASFNDVGCRTHTDVALQLVREDPDLLGGEKVEDRARIMVMITDGVPYYKGREKSEEQAIEDTITQAQLNKEDGITGIVVMVRNKHEENMPEDKHYIFDAIASDPLDKHKFPIDDLAEGVKVVFQTLARHRCPYTCSKKMDIVFVIDRSDSITPENINKTKIFFKALANSFTLGEEYAFIAMLSYNREVYIHFKLEESVNNVNSIDELIDQIPNTNDKYTETHKALKYARQSILAASPRVDATKVTMVATDGVTWITGSNAESEPNLRNPTVGEGFYYTRARYNLVIVGVPNDNNKNGYEEWIRTATDPDFDPNDPTFSPEDNIFNLQDGSSFDDLISIAPYIAEQICSLAP